MEILLNGTSVKNKVFSPISETTGAIKFSNTLNGRGTATFAIRDATGATDPLCGQSVQIYDRNGVSRFGGTIEAIHKTLLDATGGIELQVTCVSHEQRLDKRIVQSKVYESTTCGAIVADLIATYANGENIFTSAPADIQAGATVDKVIYDHDKRVSEALDELATLSNYVWYVDSDGYLFFVPRSTSVAPWTLTGADILDLGGVPQLSIDRSRSDLRTREWYRVNWAAFPATVESFTGNGSATSFHLVGDPAPYNLVNRIDRMTVTTAGSVAEVSFGALGVDTDKQWYFSPGSSVITQDAAGPVLTSADTLTVEYRALGSDVLMADDLTAIAARATAIDTGIYEHFTDDQNAVDASAALARANAFVQAYKSIALTVEFDTLKSGLRPGQVLTAAVTTPPISGGWLVESVDASLDIYASEDDFRYHIRIIDGARIGGWLQFWEKLAGVVTGAVGGGVSLGGSTYVPPEIPGSAAPAGNVSGIVLSYLYPDDKDGFPDVVVDYAAGTGTFAGVVIYDEPGGDQSNLTEARAGTASANGDYGAGGEWKPREVARKMSTDSGRVTYSFGKGVPWAATIRVYVNAVNIDGAENMLVRASEPGATPSATITLQPIKLGGKGEEYCKNPGDFSCTVTSGMEGGVHMTHVKSSFTGPIFGDGAYIEVPYTDANGVDQVNVALGIAAGGAENWFATPKTTQTVKVRARGYVAQLPGVDDDRVNSYEPGITPEFEITIGKVDGTIDVGESIAAGVATHMAVVNKVLGVAPLGITNDLVAVFAIAEANLAAAAVATSKIASGAVDSTKIANAAVGNANIQNLAVSSANIQSGAITTVKVTNGAITNALIANLAVATANIQDLAITDAKIANLSVGKLTAGQILVASTGVGVQVKYSAGNFESKMFPGAFSANNSLGATTAILSANLSSDGGGLFLANSSGLLRIQFQADLGTGYFAGGIGVDGYIANAGMPASYPGAGSKKLWYDPSDGNTVKFAS